MTQESGAEKEPTVTAKATAEFFKAGECFEFRLLREMRLVEYRKKNQIAIKRRKNNWARCKERSTAIVWFYGAG